MRTPPRPLFVATGGHWRRNYSRRSFLRLAGAAAAAAALAYSGADEKIDALHAGSVRSPGTDGVSRRIKPSGERFWFLAWLGVAVTDAWVHTSAFTRWGRRNFEAMVVGLPVLWTVQRGLGGQRPSAERPDPRWRPLQTDKAASGHTFMAAVPWLNLAQTTGRRDLRWLARLGSTLTGWSRINDRQHYLSQVILGWTIAANAAAAVADPPSAPPALPATEGGGDAIASSHAD